MAEWQGKLTNDPMWSHEPDEQLLGWHLPANLRWLAYQDERPGYLPCGSLTGSTLLLMADRWEDAVMKNRTLQDELDALRSPPPNKETGE